MVASMDVTQDANAKMLAYYALFYVPAVMAQLAQTVTGMRQILYKLWYLRYLFNDHTCSSIKFSLLTLEGLIRGKKI